jgi:thiamine biosynthesis lipoprotein
MRRLTFIRIAVAAAVVAAAAAVSMFLHRPPAHVGPERYEKTAPAMGTFVTVSAFAPDAAAGGEAIDAALDTVSRLEHLLSYFDPDSDVSRINAAPPGVPVKVSLDTVDCLARSLDLSGRTGGAFDVTVGPLVALWKAAAKSGVLPSDAEIAAARDRVSWQALSVDAANSTVTASRPGLYIDLSSKAKGYIVNRAAGAMRALGISAGFVNGGGDIAFIGSNPDGSPWRVGIADPRDANAVLGVIYVRDCGVITSGNYQQSAEIAGRRLSHIIDPHTGWPLEEPAAPVSVTVVASDAAAGAGWSTALSVLGRAGAKAAQDAGIDFLMYFPDGDKLTAFESPGMAKYKK